MIPEWLSAFRVTGTWEEHIARGSAGGVDFGTPVGTPIYAPPGGGYVDFRYFADGSSVIRVKRPDGTATEFLHGRLVGTPRAVVGGVEIIGTSDGRPGSPGSGPSDGAHLHVHDVTADGRRVRPFATISSAIVAASLPSSTPITASNPLEDEDMTRPLFFRKTAGAITNSIYLIVIDTDTLTAIEIDGRTPAGQIEIASFQNQQGQYFDRSGQGIAYAPITLAPPTYDAIRAKCTVLTPAYPPFK